MYVSFTQYDGATFIYDTNLSIGDIEHRWNLTRNINPIEEHDIIYLTDKLINPENLITTSGTTHNKIHYSQEEPEEPWVERTPGDTILWVRR